MIRFILIFIILTTINSKIQSQILFNKDSIAFDTFYTIPKIGLEDDFVLFILINENSCKNCYIFIDKCLSSFSPLKDSFNFKIAGINYFNDSNEIIVKQIETIGLVTTATNAILINKNDYLNLIKTFRNSKPELILYHNRHYYLINYHQIFNIYSGLKNGYDCKSILNNYVSGFSAYFSRH